LRFYSSSASVKAIARLHTPFVVVASAANQLGVFEEGEVGRTSYSVLPSCITSSCFGGSCPILHTYQYDMLPIVPVAL
jgi:hypothetical protein